MTDCSWVTVLEIHRRVARPSLTSDGCWMKRITNQYSASVSGTNSCQLQSEHLLIKWSKKTIVVYTYFYRICRMFYIRSYYLWFDHFLQLMEVHTPKIRVKDQLSSPLSARLCHVNCLVKLFYGRKFIAKLFLPFDGSFTFTDANSNSDPDSSPIAVLDSWDGNLNPDLTM